MHNLIPEQEKRAIRKDYLLRVITVFCISITAVAIFGTLLLLPAYSYLVAREASAPKEESSAFIEKIRAEESALALTAEMLSFIAPATETSPLFSAILSRVRSVSSAPGIELLSVTYSKKTGEVLIRGTARTREALIALGAALKGDPALADISVPVELLAKSRDISFELRGKFRHQ